MTDLNFPDRDSYLKWAEENPHPFNYLICPKHWWRCPVEGLNGAVFSIILAGESFAFLPDDVKSPQAINSWNENQTVSVCCKLGDERIDWLWELMRKLQAGYLCGAQPLRSQRRSPSGASKRSCFYDRFHTGPHEWERPVISIFNLPGGPGAIDKDETS